MSISALEPIVATLVADGVFGNVCYLGLETDVTVKGTQFLSDLTFINLKVDGPKGKEVMPLVIKLPRNNAEESWNRYAMFHNEITMYNEILPYFGVETNFYPQLFYGLATNGVEPEKDLLVLENLKYKNFLLSKTILFLDIDHISIAIKKIAEFHSFSLIRKHEEKESFIQMAKKFKVIDSPPAFHHEFEVINAACIERGVKPIIKKNVSVDLLTEFLNLLKHPIKMKDFISSPEEPYAVICHGDFCNNNILYKFDENEKPIDCVFFDFQFSNYGSPAIDVSFFLYLHTTAELREKYWDKILKLYWDTLRKRVSNQISLPSFNSFLRHFAERAIYGYIIASFFLPEMMDINAVYENKRQSLTTDEKLARMTSIGGEEAEHKLSEIVIHLLNKGYIQAYIELCKNKKIEC